MTAVTVYAVVGLDERIVIAHTTSAELANAWIRKHYKGKERTTMPAPFHCHPHKAGVAL